MLEPREADIPALFLVLVVLPLVAYILLGKWSEAAKKRERISLLAELAAEEARRAEAMAVADVIPLAASTKNGNHVKNGNHACARCFSPATTRCSRCKCVRYWYALILILGHETYRLFTNYYTFFLSPYMVFHRASLIVDVLC